MDIMKHRKLISETVGFNLTAFCAPFCDPTENISGLCPDLCYLTCPSSCFNTTSPDVTITAVHHTAQKLHRSLIISFSLVGLACFIYCIFMVHKHIKNKRRTPFQEEIHDHDHDHDRFVDEEHGPVLDHPIWYIRTIGLPRSTIDMITVVKYKKGEGLVEGTDCSVCLSEFEDDETLRLLPKCNHAFHLPCIDTWLGSHTNCPMCRAPIVSTPNGTLLPVLEQRIAIPEESVERERESEGLEPKDVGSSQNGVQPMRRSVSMDSLVATRLSGEVVDAQSSEINAKIVPKSLDLNQEVSRSLRRETVLMKRSFSCSGNVLFSRQSRGRNSVLPQ